MVFNISLGAGIAIVGITIPLLAFLYKMFGKKNGNGKTAEYIPRQSCGIKFEKSSAAIRSQELKMVKVETHINMIKKDISDLKKFREEDQKTLADIKLDIQRVLFIVNGRKKKREKENEQTEY